MSTTIEIAELRRDRAGIETQTQRMMEERDQHQSRANEHLKRVDELTSQIDKQLGAMLYVDMKLKEASVVEAQLPAPVPSTRQERRMAKRKAKVVEPTMVAVPPADTDVDLASELGVTA